ncbi:MAG: hypothetical protein ABI587_11685 [Gemmatimonadales bacterium]
MTWYRLNSEAALTEREVDRALAMRIPFLLDFAATEIGWPDRRGWDLNFVAEFVAGRNEGAALLDLALRTDRILVTRDTAFLDDSRFPPASSPGVFVVTSVWGNQLDEFLTTMVGLLGPFRALYHGVKVEARGAGAVTITAPAGRTRRVTRSFQLDREGLPMLTGLRSSDGRTSGYPGYRRAVVRTPLHA